MDLPRSAVEIMEERARRIRLERERRAIDTRQRVIDLLRARLPSGGRAWLIGSLAWGGFGDRSDVDVVVDGMGRADLVALELALSQAGAAEIDLMELAALPRGFRARVEHEGFAVHGD